MHPVARVPIKHFFVDLRLQQYLWFNVYFQEVFCIYESPEDGHRSGPKHVMEVTHIKPQILLRTEIYKKVFDK
jgi:hypothetical protein